MSLFSTLLLKLHAAVTYQAITQVTTQAITLVISKVSYQAIA